LVLVALLWSGVAEAKVLELYGQAQLGGGSGRGIVGDQKDDDFFEGAGGASYGVKVGAELLWLDGWIEHNQFTDGDIVGTWTQFMLGMDWDFALGEEPPPGQRHKTYGQVGFAVGFGAGTGQQVEPPLDNGEISDKGFVGQVSFGAEYRMSKVFGVGLSVPITYGYLFKNDGAANDESEQYQSISAMALVTFRFFIDVK
jgi:hypothetical protein